MFLLLCFLHLIGDIASEGIPSNDTATLQVAYRYGPNSPIPDSRNKPPTLAEIFKQDMLRAAYLLDRSSSGAEQSGVSIPLSYGIPFGTGDYILTVGIGTPPINQTVILDTGSHICWIQCRPCRKCFKQRDAIWNSSNSSSYKRLPCSASRCDKRQAYGLECSRDKSRCMFNVDYGDGSHTDGSMGLDVLSLGSVEFPDFMFGCGNNNLGTFKGVAGLFGMGMQPTSLVSQISDRLFSYCLTRTTTGFLKIGSVTTSGPISYTPMMDPEMFSGHYGIKLEGITVGNKRLRSSEYGIVDSGLVFTQLPHELYSELHETFVAHMSSYPTLQMPEASLLTTCFDFRSVGGWKKIKAPTISLHFLGKGVVHLDSSKTIVPAPDGSPFGCLAFVNASTLILGNWQQTNFEVIYDLGKQRIGFRPNAC